MRRTRGLALVVMLAGAGLVVSACGSDSARSAAEEELDADEVVVVDDAEPGDADDIDSDTADSGGNPTEPAEPENLFELVTSGHLGTQVCVRNETGEPTGISVNFSKSDSSNSGSLLAAGDEQQRCGEGTVFIGNDVIGKIYFSKEGSATYEFRATNPWAGKPSGGFNQDTSRDNACKAGDFEVGNAVTYDDGLYSITMSRQSDSKWKEFLITIKPTTEPTTDGKAKQCPPTTWPR